MTNDVVMPPAWLAWVESGVGLPPEPPTRNGGDGWRPRWDWTHLLIGLYCAWLAFNVIEDILAWRTARASR